jgi:23S rRNA (uracil1939-C5)-methyltransferase
MARRRLPPFEIEITSMAPKGLGEGIASDGAPMRVRNAVVGARVKVVPAGRRKGVWTGRKVHTVRPPVDGVAPRCAVFGLCGGCMLQEASLASQREAKHRMALQLVRDQGTALDDVVVHSVRGTPAAYGYRNRVELSFGNRRWLAESDQKAGVAQAGRFVGMHAPGRFDRIVDTERCELVSDEMNELLGIVRTHALHPDAPPPRDPRSHEGFWRHVRLREGAHTGERLVALFTTSATGDEATWVERLADALMPHVVGVVWVVNDEVADVARGDVARVWGRSWLEEGLGERRFRLSYDSFFQTNTFGAELLYDAIGEAVGRGGRLLDLYCGTGSIGIYLADRFDEVVGLEEVEAAVRDARANAERNGVRATYRAAKVEDALDALGSDAHVVVDPPRAGLHPKVARKLATLDATSMVYVACHPKSLGRDAVFLAEGGWRLVELWVVDLFPQTGHVEMVGRFER